MRTKRNSGVSIASRELLSPWRILLVSPGAVLIGITLLVPLCWLTYASFLDPDGAYTLANYARLFQPIYWVALRTTFWLSATVTLGCVILGYPLCYLMCKLPRRATMVCLALVMLPFWTSTLVRTFSWLIILQRKGLLNTLLLNLGLIESPLRLAYSFTGTAIGLINIMLPFLILPLYSSMSTIDGNLQRAAASCGATPTRAFWDVFFPATVPALIAGVTFVFIMCLGFYVTPAVLGGGRVLMWSMQIETIMKASPTWGPVAALGVALAIIASSAVLALKSTARLARRGD